MNLTAGLLALAVPVAFMVHVVVTLLYYAAVMTFMMARDLNRLNPVLTTYGKGVLLGGLFLDGTLNLLWGTLVFLRLPQDWLLTGRLIRYKRENTGWRSKLAVWICATFLDPLAPSGCHCNTH